MMPKIVRLKAWYLGAGSPKHPRTAIRRILEARVALQGDRFPVGGPEWKLVVRVLMLLSYLLDSRHPARKLPMLVGIWRQKADGMVLATRLKTLTVWFRRRFDVELLPCALRSTVQQHHRFSMPFPLLRLVHRPRLQSYYTGRAGAATIYSTIAIARGRPPSVGTSFDEGATRRVALLPYGNPYYLRDNNNPYKLMISPVASIQASGSDTQRQEANDEPEP